MLFLKNKKTILLSLIALMALSLLFYIGDKDYLQEKSADKVWLEFSDTIDQIAGKGDFITYKGDNTGSSNKWLKYSERFSEHVAQLNKKNEPLVKNRYLLSTTFREIDSRVMITFAISEESTGQAVEEKEIITDPIKYTSVIPAVLALFLCFATARPIISLFVSLLLGSILYNGYSVILGTKEVVYNYLPYGLSGNNLNMVLFFIIISLFLRVLSGAGGFKSLLSTKKPLRYLLFPFLYFHPYVGVTAGAWMQHSFAHVKNKPLRSSFVAHVLAMLISSLFLYNYHGIELKLLADSLQFRFFFAAAISMLVFFFLFNRTTKTMETMVRPEQEQKQEQKEGEIVLFKEKSLVKIRPYIGALFLLLFVVLFALSSLLIGSLQMESHSKILNIKHYIAASNTSSALVLSSLASLLILLWYTLRTRLLNLKDVYGYILGYSTNLIYFAVMLFLSFSFARVLNDMGSAYYIISLFKVKIGTPFFPFVCFVISIVTTFMSGNSLITSTIIIPILLPIAGQLGGNVSSANAIAAILEGCIAGELLSPYSPTAIMVSSIFKINPAKHSASMLPYVGLAVVGAAFIGFMLSGTNSPLWLSYLVLFLFFLLTMFKKTSKVS